MSREFDRYMNAHVAQWERVKRQAMQDGLSEKAAEIAADYSTGTFTLDVDPEAMREYRQAVAAYEDEEQPAA